MKRILFALHPSGRLGNGEGLAEFVAISHQESAPKLTVPPGICRITARTIGVREPARARIDKCGYRGHFLRAAVGRIGIHAEGAKPTYDSQS
jgi:hypothetical protein